MENTIIARQTEITNKELKKATDKIIKANKSMVKNLFVIASTMAEVEQRGLYADDFKNIAEYGMKVFGYKKSAVNNMVRVGLNYIDPETGRSILIEEGEDFNFSQLVRLLPLPSVDDAVEMVENEEITPDMTVKEIEKAVKARLNNTPDEEGEGEGEGEGESKTEPEVIEPAEFAIHDNEGVIYYNEKQLLEYIRATIEAGNIHTFHISKA